MCACASLKPTAPAGPKNQMHKKEGSGEPSLPGTIFLLGPSCPHTFSLRSPLVVISGPALCMLTHVGLPFPCPPPLHPRHANNLIISAQRNGTNAEVALLQRLLRAAAEDLSMLHQAALTGSEALGLPGAKFVSDERNDLFFGTGCLRINKVRGGSADAQVPTHPPAEAMTSSPPARMLARGSCHGPCISKRLLYFRDELAACFRLSVSTLLPLSPSAALLVRRRCAPAPRTPSTRARGTDWTRSSATSCRRVNEAFWAPSSCHFLGSTHRWRWQAGDAPEDHTPLFESSSLLYLFPQMALLLADGPRSTLTLKNEQYSFIWQVGAADLFDGLSTSTDLYYQEAVAMCAPSCLPPKSRSAYHVTKKAAASA